MKCLKCAAQLIDGAKFCPECGTPAAQEIACPHCGGSVPSDAMFCHHCGNKVKGGPAAAPGPKVEQVEPQPATVGSEFVYFIGEEQMHQGANDKAFPPYGCIGVVVVNGRVERIYNQASATIKAGQSASTPLKDFFERMMGGVKDLVAHRQNLLTYVIGSLRELPVVTYTRKPQIPGSPNGLLKFEFWIDHPDQDIKVTDQAVAPEQQRVLNNVGVFLTKFVSGKSGLTYSDFKRIASEQVELLLASYKMGQLVEEQAVRNQLMADLEKLTGISGRCTYDSGRQLQRYQFDVTKAVRPVSCPSCSTQYTQKVKFCEECGHNLSPAALWVDMYRPLLSKEGESVTLRLSLMRDRTDDAKVNVAFSDDLITTLVVTELEPILRRTPIDQMLSQSFLASLSETLNRHLPTDWQGYVKDFEVTDLRTTKEDWFFRTDALIAEQIRAIDADKRALAVGDAELDLEEVKLALAMREVRFRDDEYLTRKRQEYETARKAAELDAAKEVDDHALQTQTELKKDQLDTQAYSERAEMERQRMSSDRQTTEMLRQDEHSQVDHEISLEKKAAGHDIDLREMGAVADSRQFRRETDDRSYDKRSSVDDEAYGLQKVGNVQEDLADRQQNRQIDKLRAMAELEAKMAQQDQQHELTKTKQEQEHELAKRENMKSLSAAEMLAIQAAELAKAGGGAAAADIVKAIAESQAAAEKAKAEAAGTGIKEEMYERMLKMQMESTQATIEAHKGAASMAQSVNEKAMEQMAKVSGAATSQSLEGYKSAAEIAQSTNEKSMESMAKVATATASRKTSGEKDEPEKYKCVNPSCDRVFDKPMKFCPGCGEKQQTA